MYEEIPVPAPDNSTHYTLCNTHLAVLEAKLRYAGLGDKILDALYNIQLIKAGLQGDAVMYCYLMMAKAHVASGSGNDGCVICLAKEDSDIVEIVVKHAVIADKHGVFDHIAEVRQGLPLQLADWRENALRRN